MLEKAGCQIIYGLEGYKVHSKLCLITRRGEDGVEYITQIGTGNYNEKTARLYTDLSLMTADEEIGLEATRVFQALTKGETVEESEHLLVAPKCLQSKVIDMIDEEIRCAQNGEEAYIGLKLNSLTDKKIMDKLAEASRAGVRIDMIVRGICCPDRGRAGRDGEHPGYQHCRQIPGTFENLYLWMRGADKVLYRFRRFYDKEYGQESGSCRAGLL